MLHLDKTEYDLNTLFSFEVLKEILLKLARSQDKIEKEIIHIKKSNSKRNKKISKIENALHNSLGYQIEDEESSNYESEENYNGDLDENNNKIEEKEFKINEENNTNLNKNFDKINGNGDKEESKEENIQTDKDQDNISSLNRQFSQVKTVSEGGGLNISPELFSKMVKQINDYYKRLIELENKLKSESKNINNVETQIKDHILNNESEFKLMNNRINEFLEKNKDYDKKFEDLQVKVTDFDIFSMFKDNGDGTIDATKIMVRALEEKVFKKFDFVDKRNKIESLENLKTKNNVENLMPKIEQLQREIQRVEQMGNQHQEDLEKYKKENDEANNETKNNIYKDMNTKLDKLKEELEKIINDKILSVEDKIKNINVTNNTVDNFDIFKLGLGNNEINKETIEALEKKINDSRKKINDLDNTIKLYLNNNEINLIKNELKDLKSILENKITKNDLKELYNFNLNTKDELSDIKDQEAQTFDELRKTIKDLQNLQQRVESLSGNLILLQNTPRASVKVPMIDFSKYVENNKLVETLKPILKEIEKIIKEIESIRRDMSLIEDDNKNNKNSIKVLNDDVNNRITELKNFIQKKYYDKTEIIKKIKTLEIHIKSIEEETKKEADSWLLAKKPLKCFNCGSCEANINNEYSIADYLPWKKYPKGENIHRIGQGFSHMLQLMTSEFIKSIEKNENPQELEISSRNNNNNINNSQYNEKSVNNNIINNKEQNKEDVKNLKRMKLPKVNTYSQFSNPKIKLRKFEDSVPISDDEENYIEKYNRELEIKAKNNSPKILKIKKLDKSTFCKGNVKDMYGNLTAMRGSFSNIRNTGTEGKSVYIKTENNFNDNLNDTSKN